MSLVHFNPAYQEHLEQIRKNTFLITSEIARMANAFNFFSLDLNPDPDETFQESKEYLPHPDPDLILFGGTIYS